MRVLVTGLSGFTGAHLVALLKRDGHEVFGLGPDSCTMAHGELIADLSETGRIANWLNQARPTHVLHLAAISHVVGEPLPFYQVNVLGTESLLQAIDQSGLAPEKIVLASSANVYGNNAAATISEREPTRPVNHYGLSKAAMELLATKWTGTHPIIIVRPFNYTGPGQSDRFVFPKIVKAFAQAASILTLGNIDVSRDVSDVRDVCEIYRRLLLDGAPGTTVNICSGTAVSLSGAIDTMAKLARYRPEIRVDPKFIRVDEIKRLVGDTTKLDAMIGPMVRRPIGETLGDMFVDATARG